MTAASASRGAFTPCGDKERTSDDEVLVCDRPAGHLGNHSCVVVVEQRMRWLQRKNESGEQVSS